MQKKEGTYGDNGSLHASENMANHWMENKEKRRGFQLAD
jgi:hypothetical protein